MTGRRLTSAEAEFNAKRACLLKKLNPEYVADAPFVFSSRLSVAGMLTRVELFNKVRKIPGHIIECGVYRGNSLMLLNQLSILLEPYSINRSIVGFDTFDGFASINSERDPSDISEDNFSDTDMDVINEMIQCNDLTRPVSGIPRCEVIKGDIMETLPKFVENTPHLLVSMLILDTDLYEPTKLALEKIVPHMPKGGVVALDEVAYRHFAGETVAFKEALNINNVKLKKFQHESCLGYFKIGE